MNTVFITGATGFVGSHTACEFLGRGWRVKALVRSPTRSGLLPAGAEVVRGDLLNSVDYRDALADCAAIVHAAGLVKARSLAAYQRANRDGTEAIARCWAEVCPAAKFVLVSSQSAAGPAREGRAITESDPARPVSWYGQSKLEGEEALMRHARGPWCVVRPSAVYGPGDPGFLELFKTVQGGIAPLPAGGHSRVQLIAVADLARLLVAVTSRSDLIGRRGFAAVDTVTMGELIREIAALRSPRARVVPVPAWLLRTAGLWESIRQALTHKAGPFNRDKAREMLQKAWLCDPALMRESGISDLTPWKEGIRDLCRCYVAAGWLKPSRWAV